MKTKIWPVIHINELDQAIENANIAFSNGCEGIFLIEMNGNDNKVPYIALTLKSKWPNKHIGINYLSCKGSDTLLHSVRLGLDAAWTDAPEVRSDFIGPDAHLIQKRIAEHNYKSFFGSVAFKYQLTDHNPGEAARRALAFSMIPTTSGTATGSAPDVQKIIDIRNVIGNECRLAIASGITPDNVGVFSQHVSDILVSTGISKTFHEFDSNLVEKLVKNCL